ncbi:hypothetical protein HK405_014838, partial [Cladochytrium tenue]
TGDTVTWNLQGVGNIAGIFQESGSGVCTALAKANSTIDIGSATLPTTKSVTISTAGTYFFYINAILDTCIEGIITVTQAASSSSSAAADSSTASSDSASGSGSSTASASSGSSNSATSKVGSSTTTAATSSSKATSATTTYPTATFGAAGRAATAPAPLLVACTAMAVLVFAPLFA